MKKIFILTVATLVAGMMFADNLRLMSGSLNALKDSGEYAYVEIDWSKAQVVEFDGDFKIDENYGSMDEYNKRQGGSWTRDWPQVQLFVALSTAWDSYPGRPTFNKRNDEGVQITVNPEVWKAYQDCTDEETREDMRDHCLWVDPSGAKYKFILRVEYVDMGNSGAAHFGSLKTGGAILAGIIDLIEIATGNQLAQVSVYYCKGHGMYAQQSRLMDVVSAEVFGKLYKLIPEE